MIHATPAQQGLGLRIHSMSFIAGMVILVIVNWFTGPPYWVGWVLLGWGIGLLAHWLSVRNIIASGGNSRVD